MHHAALVTDSPGAHADPWRGHRVVMHADMDAFYAAVEQRERPELRGRPVIVGGRRDARGVVTAASYEARAFGVHAAMPLRNAARLCPRGAFVSPRMDLYAGVSTRILEILRTYTPLVEPLSLDEAFLDVSGCERRYGSPRSIAAHVREAVRQAEGLTVSVGVASTKSVAKIASDLEKPDGCVIVPPGRESAFLAPLPVQKLWGIGPKTSRRLAQRGIRTIGELQLREPQRLRIWLGAGVEAAWHRSQGLDARPVVSTRLRKSVGNEVTFARDVQDPALVVRYIQQLAAHVGQRLREKRLRGRTVALKLRYSDFRTITRQATLAAPVDTDLALFGGARELFGAVTRAGDSYRLVGVHVSGLTAAGYVQLPLRPPRRDARRLARALDSVRGRFGDGTVCSAALLGSAARLSADRFSWRDAVLA